MRRYRCPHSAIEHKLPVTEQGKAQLIGSVEGGST